MGLRCLIVDDSPGFLQAARALLEQKGMTVVGIASTSEAAIQHAVRQCPDVTLVDIDLGRRGIRAGPPRRGWPRTRVRTG